MGGRDVAALRTGAGADPRPVLSTTFSARARRSPPQFQGAHIFLNKNLQVMVVMQKKMEVESSCGCKQEAEQRPEDLGTRRSGLDDVLAHAQLRPNVYKHLQPKNKVTDLLKIKLDMLCTCVAARRGVC